MMNERESLKIQNGNFCSFQQYIRFLQQSMGGCVNKTAEVQISPQNYHRKAQNLRDSRKWCRQLPTKSAEESENMMTWTSIINLKQSVDPDVQVPQSEQQWVEKCLQATKGRIIRKKAKLLPQRSNEHMAVNSNSGTKPKRAERKDLNQKVNSRVAEIEFEDNDSNKNRKITVDSIKGVPSKIDNLNGSLKRRKHTKGISPKMIEKENQHKERVYLDHKLHYSSDGSIPQLAINVQKSTSFQNQAEIEGLVKQSDEIIADSSIQVEDYSLICLKNQVSNFEYMLPQSQAGPLIVSILDYERYQV